MNTLRETAKAFLAGQPVTDSTIRLVEVARRLVEVAEPPQLQEPEPAPQQMNRRHRRAAKRTFSKNR